jgi:peptidase A4-like protein
MLIKRLLTLGTIAMFPAVAQVASAPDSREEVAPRQHGPVKDLVDLGNGASTSSNWSGYAIPGTSFTSAKASWTVPAANCASGRQYAAFWVGMDGYTSSTVEQTGTDSDCTGGNPSYYAWYQFYPNPSYQIASLKIAPGDRMAAKVVYSGSQFIIAIEDVTTGKSYSTSATVPGAARSSAEWVAEAPCCTADGALLPLADFGSVLFGEDSTAIGGTNSAADSANSGVIGVFPAIQEITMTNGNGLQSGILKAYPSGLSDGTSFSVTWGFPITQ